MSEYFTSTCPRCGGENLQCTSAQRRGDFEKEECLECGYSHHWKKELMGLGQVNDSRAEVGLQPLEKLAEAAVTV